MPPGSLTGVKRCSGSEKLKARLAGIWGEVRQAGLHAGNSAFALRRVAQQAAATPYVDSGTALLIVVMILAHGPRGFSRITSLGCQAYPKPSNALGDWRSANRRRQKDA
jgi:hypothetical protein